jgi:hypothetical protein
VTTPLDGEAYLREHQRLLEKYEQESRLLQRLSAATSEAQEKHLVETVLRTIRHSELQLLGQHGMDPDDWGDLKTALMLVRGRRTKEALNG